MGCQVIGIRKSEFVANTHFLYQVCVACCMLCYIVLTTTVFHISGLLCTCPSYPEFNDVHEDSEDAEDFESSEDELSDKGIIIDLSSSEDEDENNNNRQ